MQTDSLAKLVTIVDQILRRKKISPGRRHVSAFLRALFFTSLKTEEGRPLRLRITLVNPKGADVKDLRNAAPDRWNIVRFGNRIFLTPNTLAKLASAADPWSSTIAVYFEKDGGAFIWGLVDQGLGFSKMLVREAEDGSPPPGAVQIQINGTGDLSIYRGSRFVARLRLDTLIRSEPDIFLSGPVRDGLWLGFEKHLGSVGSAFGLPGLSAEPGPSFDSTEKVYYTECAITELVNSSAFWWFGALCRLLINITRYRHGGAILITPSSDDLNVTYPIRYPRLRTSLVHSTIWAIKEYDLFFEFWPSRRRKEIKTEVYKKWHEAGRNLQNYESELAGCIRFIASLSCVDGLILANPDLTIRGFGVEILSKTEVDEVYVSSFSDPDQNTLRKISSKNFGTRHRSMFRYCYAHDASVGFVISQDGDLRAIRKVGDQLIVWENPKIMALSQRRRRGVSASDQSVPGSEAGEIGDDDIPF